MRVMPGGFERFGDFGQLPGHLARDAGRGARRVERERVSPDFGETLAHFIAKEII